MREQSHKVKILSVLEARIQFVLGRGNRFCRNEKNPYRGGYQYERSYLNADPAWYILLRSVSIEPA
jgi:hypothetical protein